MKTSKSVPKLFKGKKFRFAVVLARYNDDIGNELFKNTQKTLINYGVLPKNIHLFRVPGALEIPLASSLLAQKRKYDAIICLGVVIRGDTPHFDLVAEQCYRSLMDINLYLEIPVVFGVLTTNSLAQAKERSSAQKMNKGKEFAEAALEMAQFQQSL